MRTIFIALLFAAISATALQAKAEPYVTAGFGQSKTCHIGIDGCWYQSPWDYKIDEHANTWHFGFGQSNLFGLKWLSGEIRYHDLGEYNIFAGFAPSDENFSVKEDDGCIGKCPPTSYGYGHANVRALSLSLMPEYAFGKSAVYARLGIARVKAKYEVLITNGNDSYAKQLGSYKPPRYMLWEPQFGVGIRFNNVSLEYTEISPMKPEDSCISKSKTVTVSYRWSI